jgi:hypothetical protein
MADSAQGLIRTTLDRYGLGSLANWAWTRYQLGDSIEEILLEMRSTTEYKTRFPAMDQLSREGNAISEEAYVSYEQGLANLVTRFGLPSQVYTTREYVADLLTKRISLSEAQSRMELAVAASTTSPREYSEAAARMFGITPGQWTSIWLETDRTLPVLEKQFAQASVAGEATIRNLGDLSTQMSQRLVEAGINREQARQGFARATRETTVKLPGEAESGLGVDVVAAGVLGLGEEAQRFTRLMRQRVASFASSGSVVTTGEGAGGLGSTQR